MCALSVMAATTTVVRSDLSYNRLSGAVPFGISALSSLVRLYARARSSTHWH
jgi:hypothetical protein